MSIRRKRRQRSKRKEIQKQAQAVWDRLSQASKSCAPPDMSVILPMIRKLTPGLIANDLVGVQPLGMPSMVSVNCKFAKQGKYEITNKDTAQKKRTERKEKKRRRSTMEKARRLKRTSN